MKFFLIFSFIFLLHCSPKEHRYSFYYWRTELKLDKIEREKLTQSSSETLYTRFFDVDKKDGQFLPVGLISNSSPLNVKQHITPVVFITNRTFIGIAQEEIPALAQKIFQLVQKIKEQYQFNISNEIQIDCDWTLQTRDHYFQFLKELKTISQKNITCTLRLHQIKDKKETGIPPVEKGYLMCYATASPLDNQPKNSILDVPTLKNYLKDIDKYSLKMDIALPLYSWGIVSNHLGKKKLINALTTKDLSENKNFKKISEIEYEVLNDDFYFGMYMNKGFKIKIEEISQNQLNEVKSFLDQKIKNYHIVYYHLDSKFITKYNL